MTLNRTPQKKGTHLANPMNWDTGFWLLLLLHDFESFLVLHGTLNCFIVMATYQSWLQLCVWGMNAWDKQGSKFLQIPPGRTSGPIVETRVQFHQDQVQFLVVHESQIAIYEARKLECLKQVRWPIFFTIIYITFPTINFIWSQLSEFI